MSAGGTAGQPQTQQDLSVLLRLEMVIALLAAFLAAFLFGIRTDSIYTFWGILGSGLLWWLASTIPVWVRKAVLAPAIFNSGAASAAVFAGMVALPATQLQAILGTWLPHR